VTSTVARLLAVVFALFTTPAFATVQRTVLVEEFGWLV
jgi:hypothetical protein